MDSSNSNDNDRTNPLAAVSTVPLTPANVVSDKDCDGGHVTLVGFSHPGQTLVLQGYTLVGCLQGALSIANYTLLAPRDADANPDVTRLHPLIAPACYSLPVIHSLAIPQIHPTDALPIPLTSSTHIARVSTDSDLGRVLRSLLRKLAKATPLASFTSILCLVSMHWANLHAIQQPIPEFASLFTPRQRDQIKAHPLIPVPNVYPVLPPTAPPQVSTVACPTSWQAVLDQVLAESVTNYATLATLGPDTPAELAQYPVLVATGNKSQGKSTFNRLAVNSLLARFPRVAVLDVDPGQAEFTPPGVLALTLVDFPLLGAPGYMFQPTDDHMVDARWLGSTSPSADPDYYLHLVHGLLDSYFAVAQESWRKSKQVVPLVINAMGWVKSLGLQVLCETLAHAVPTWIVVLNSGPQDFAAFPVADLLAPWPSQADDTDGPRFRPQVLSMQGLAPAAASRGNDLVKLSPADLRLLSLTTHLLGRPHPPLSTTSLTDLTLGRGPAWLSATPLTHRDYPLMHVPVRDTHVVFLHADVPPAEVLAAINATLVALVRVPDDPRAHLAAEHRAWAARVDAPTSARTCHADARWIGLGVVRAVVPGDAGRRLVVATPVPAHRFVGDVVVVRGDVDVTNALMTWGLPRTEVARQPGPYLTAVVPEGRGARGGSVRRNVGRVGLQQGRNKAG